MKVPFYANTKDNTHCYQAAIRMVLKYFLPDKEYSWEELDTLTNKKGNYWTWPQKGVLNLYKMGFEIIDMDMFDDVKFIKLGEKYLGEKYGKDIAKRQVENTYSIKEEQGIYKEYSKLGMRKLKAPKLDDIKHFIDEGYLVVCNINSHALEGVAGYTGHSVVIYDYDDRNLFLHDPGLPPLEGRKVPNELFLKSWEYPNKEARNLTAFRFGGPGRSRTFS